jgi:putative intracellular protease/amidase
MPATIDVLGKKRILIVASNPTVSETIGERAGFWWAEVTHSYWEFVSHGYDAVIASPDGGALEADSWSDPRDKSGLMAEDILTLGFINSPGHAALVQNTPALSEVLLDDFSAIFLAGGQGPMYTFANDKRVHELVVSCYEKGKITAVVCHATCVLLKTRLPSGDLLVTGKTWTGFANSEEDYADAFFGRQIQPFRIQTEATKLPDTNFIVQGRFRPHALRDGLLITGQQQYSAAAAARLVIDALGR